MDSGKILVAEHDGIYAIKMVGDVRVTVCPEFDAYLNQILAKPNYVDCMVDLSEADHLDSTTLGLMAKVAVRSNQAHKTKPTIMAPSDNIQRLLSSMHFDKVFKVNTGAVGAAESYTELDSIDCSEAELREKVIDAHRVLMGLSKDNEVCFSSLVTALENEQKNQS